MSKIHSSAGSVGVLLVRKSFRTHDWKPDGLPSVSIKGCQFLRPDIRFADVRFATLIFKSECTHRWSRPVPKQLSCQDLSCSNCKPPIMKSNCVKALSLTRLQVQLSSTGMLVSSLLNMHKPCCNTHLASNCPRTLRLPNPQVPNTAEPSPFSHAPKHALKSPPNKGKAELWAHSSNKTSNNPYTCSTSSSECHVVGMYTAIAHNFKFRKVKRRAHTRQE